MPRRSPMAPVDTLVITSNVPKSQMNDLPTWAKDLQEGCALELVKYCPSLSAPSALPNGHNNDEQFKSLHSCLVKHHAADLSQRCLQTLLTSIKNIKHDLDHGDSSVEIHISYVYHRHLHKPIVPFPPAYLHSPTHYQPSSSWISCILSLFFLPFVCIGMYIVLQRAFRYYRHCRQLRQIQGKGYSLV